MKINEQINLSSGNEIDNCEMTISNGDRKVKLKTLTYVTKKNGDKTAFIMTNSFVGTDKPF